MEVQDEMNLIEFLRLLWQQKGLILLVTLCSLMIGAVYIFLSRPVYEAAAYLKPPSYGDIVYINQGRSKGKKALLTRYKSNQVYQFFTKTLQSESFKRFFFNKIYLPSVQTKDKKIDASRLYVKFARSLIIKEFRDLPIQAHWQSVDYRLSFRGRSAQYDAELVKKYIELANEKARGELLLKLNQQRMQLVQVLRDKITAIRKVANLQRLDRMEQLQEAIKVAQAVGNKGKAHTSLNAVITDASVANNPSMMYLRGSTALQAELDNLSKRRSSDAFAAKSMKLRETQGLYDFYEKINYNKDKLIMFKLDGEVSIPELSIAIPKKLILFLSLLAGLFFGIVIVSLRKPLALILR